MSIKKVKFAFSLLFVGILPVMGMEKHPTFKEAQKAISSTIEKNARKYYGMPLNEQKTLDISFNLNDIKKIAKNDIDKGILLENHLEDLLSINPKSTETSRIRSILANNYDKQQKLMGLIECASFIGSPIDMLILYGLASNLIPKEMLEGSDNTIDSFYVINNIENNIQEEHITLVKNILPSSIFKPLCKPKQKTEYQLDHTFNPIINDIKTLKYKKDEKHIEKTDDLSAFEIQNTSNFTIKTNSKKLEQRDATTKSIQELFTTTSLPNKIALILRLNDLNKKVSENIDTTKIVQGNLGRYDTLFKIFISNFLAFGLFIFVNAYEEKEMTGSLSTKVLTITGNPDYSDSIKLAAAKEFHESINSITPGRIASKALYTICFNKNFKLLGALMTVFGIGIFKYAMSFTDASETSLVMFGSLTGLTPLPQLYFLYKYFFQQLPHDNELGEMKKEQKNIQNLIEEFKESVKKEYKN